MAQFLQGLDTMGQFYKDSATGLGQGLAGLAQAKMKQIEKGNLAKGLGSLLGLSPEESHAYSNLPPDILKEVVRSKVGMSGARQVAREDQLRKHYLPQVETLLQKEKNLRGILEAAQSKGGRTYMGSKGLGALSQFNLSPALQRLKGYSDELLIQEQAEASRSQGGRMTESIRKQVEEGKLGLHLPPDELMRRAKEKLKETELKKKRLFSTYPFLKDSPEIEDLMSNMQPEAKVEESVTEKTPTGIEKIKESISNQMDGLDEKTLTTYTGPGFQVGSGDVFKWDELQKRYIKVPRKKG